MCLSYTRISSFANITNVLTRTARYWTSNDLRLSWWHHHSGHLIVQSGSPQLDPANIFRQLWSSSCELRLLSNSRQAMSPIWYGKLLSWGYQGDVQCHRHFQEQGCVCFHRYSYRFVAIISLMLLKNLRLHVSHIWYFLWLNLGPSSTN